jgi:SAM-dependent methyltransferase
MPHPLIAPLADALEDWRQCIAGNRAQVDRMREVADGSDFYAPVTRAFRAPDPRQQHEPTLDVLRNLLRPGDSVLDIGAGGGRYALPLALDAAEVLAVDPSKAMLRTLQDGLLTRHRIQNVRAIHSAWPMTDPPGVDIALAAHVLYDIDDVEPFLAAMEASARRLCVLVMAEETPPTPIDRLWPEVHGEPRVELPALPELLALLLARGTLFDLTLTERPSLATSVQKTPWRRRVGTPGYGRPARRIAICRRCCASDWSSVTGASPSRGHQCVSASSVGSRTEVWTCSCWPSHSAPGVRVRPPSMSV